jgi:cupin 2 domain-containing protein
MSNIFDDLATRLDEEEFTAIIETAHIKIERIVSTGHHSEEGFWYDQADHEWVLVLQGSGVIEYEDGRMIELNVGDYVNIPTHQKHRVKETSQSEPTVWLAVHYK